MNEKKNHRDRLFRLMTAVLALWLVCWGISLAMEPYRTLCSPWLYSFLPVTLLFLGLIELLVSAEQESREDADPDQVIFRLLLPQVILLSVIWALDELFSHTVWGAAAVTLLRLAAVGIVGFQIRNLFHLYRSAQAERKRFSPEMLWKAARSVLIVLLCVIALLPVGDGERLEEWETLNGRTGSPGSLYEGVAQLEEALNADGGDVYQFVLEDSAASPAGAVMEVSLERNSESLVSFTWFRSYSELHRLAAECSVRNLLSQGTWNAPAGDSVPLRSAVINGEECWLLAENGQLLTMRFPQELTREQRTELLSFFGLDAA